MYTILDSLVDNIAIVNATGEIVYTNTSWKQFALTNSGVVAKTDVGVNYLLLCKSVTGEDIQNAKDAAIGIQKVLERELEVFEMEYACHSPNEKRWFMMRCTPQKNLDNHAIISHINITSRKLAEEKIDRNSNQLKEINKRYNVTLYKTVHDIQSPLNQMEALIQLMKSGNVDTYVPLLEKSVAGLKHFVRETLKISESPLVVESVDFESILNDFKQSRMFFDVLKHVEIRLNIHQNVQFYTYKAEIISVISNIINNGLKYSDESKPIQFVEVNVNVSEQEAIISIKDNGIGISKDDLPKIFDLNFKALKKESSGFGVGLNLVKKSVEFMYGHIKVNSELNSGTEFMITIPNLKDNNQFIPSTFIS